MVTSFDCPAGDARVIVVVGETMSFQPQSVVGQSVWQRNLAAAGEAVRRLARDESGQDMIEYVLVAALIGLGTLVGVHSAANTIVNIVLQVGTNFTSAV
jgi:pilus assembly protein Flp/PilA